MALTFKQSIHRPETLHGTTMPGLPMHQTDLLFPADFVQRIAMGWLDVHGTSYMVRTITITSTRSTNHDISCRSGPYSKVPTVSLIRHSCHCCTLHINSIHPPDLTAMLYIFTPYSVDSDQLSCIGMSLKNILSVQMNLNLAKTEIMELRPQSFL